MTKKITKNKRKAQGRNFMVQQSLLHGTEIKVMQDGTEYKGTTPQFYNAAPAGIKSDWIQIRKGLPFVRVSPK